MQQEKNNLRRKKAPLLKGAVTEGDWGFLPNIILIKDKEEKHEKNNSNRNHLRDCHILSRYDGYLKKQQNQ